MAALGRASRKADAGANKRIEEGDFRRGRFNSIEALETRFHYVRMNVDKRGGKEESGRRGEKKRGWEGERA